MTGRRIHTHAELNALLPRAATPNQESFSRAHKKLEPPDLIPSEIHEGYGTGVEDPYKRTLPNLHLKPPESTVVGRECEAKVSPEQLRRMWLGPSQWLGSARLETYVRSLMLDELPVTREMISSLDEFSQIISEACKAEKKDPIARVKQWKALLAQSTSELHLFEPQAYVDALAKLNESILGFLDVSHKEALSAVAATVRRQAIARRNALLSSLAQFVADVARQKGAGGLWASFMESVSRHSSTLLEDERLRVMWDATQCAGEPAMPANVALLFVVTAAVQPDTRKDSVPDAAGSHLNAPSPRFPHVSADAKRDFLKRHVSDLVLRYPRRVAQALKQLKHYEAHNALRLFETARIRNQQQLRSDIEPLIPLFADVRPVKALFHRIANSNSRSCKDKLALILGVPAESFTSVEEVVKQIDWHKEYPRIASDVLSDQELSQVLHMSLEQEVAQSKQKRDSKSPIEGLISTSALHSIFDVISSRGKKQAALDSQLDAVRQLLLYRIHIEDAIVVALSSGAPDGELTQLEEREAALLSRQTLPSSLAVIKPLLLQNVVQCNPHWVKANVISDCTSTTPSALLKTFLNVYLRLAYCPAAATAVMKAQFRGRLGPVGLHPHQHNVPVEMGAAEHYDNLEYKQYDWQGWYQRMVDIYHRNVSIRCRISDLTQLDAQGRAFFCMQSERRLRVLAGERVGCSIIKLDSDRFEDQKDNEEYGVCKMNQLLSESKKAQLGKEYWPTVEVKVWRPSGQTKMRYSLMDWDRVEKSSADSFAKYKQLKKTAVYVPATSTWMKLDTSRTKASAQEEDKLGYTVDTLFQTMSSENAPKPEQ